MNLRNYGIPGLEERKKQVVKMLRRGRSISVFDVMGETVWSKSVCYKTLIALDLITDISNRKVYYSLIEVEQLNVLTSTERLKSILFFYSITERRCEAYE